MLLQPLDIRLHYKYVTEATSVSRLYIAPAITMHIPNPTLLPLFLTICLALICTTSIRPSLALFLSIDCGASDSYTDRNSIRWVGDDDYVSNGESHLMEFSNALPPVVNTLRAFPTLRKKLLHHQR